MCFYHLVELGVGSVLRCDVMWSPSKVPKSLILEGECSKPVSLCLKIRWSTGDPQNQGVSLFVFVLIGNQDEFWDPINLRYTKNIKTHTVTDMEIGSVKSGNQWMINNPQVLKVWWFSEAGAEEQATGGVISPFDCRWFLAIERLTLMVDTKEEFAQLKVVFGHAIYTSSRVIKSRKKRLTCSFSGRCHLQYIFRYSYHQIAGLMFYYEVLFLHGREWDPWRLVGKLSTSIKEWRMAGRS